MGSILATLPCVRLCVASLVFFCRLTYLVSKFVLSTLDSTDFDELSRVELAEVPQPLPKKGGEF
ncbi:MAG: hypothetical protein WD648_15050 [Planctomycetaceae bacterium]